MGEWMTPLVGFLGVLSSLVVGLIASRRAGRSEKTAGEQRRREEEEREEKASAERARAGTADWEAYMARVERDAQTRVDRVVEDFQRRVQWTEKEGELRVRDVEERLGRVEKRAEVAERVENLAVAYVVRLLSWIGEKVPGERPPPIPEELRVRLVRADDPR